MEQHRSLTGAFHWWPKGGVFIPNSVALLLLNIAHILAYISYTHAYVWEGSDDVLSSA